jgi:hypothetical protein
LISRELVAFCATADLGAPLLLLCFSDFTDFREGKDPAAAVEVDRRLNCSPLRKLRAVYPLDDGVDTLEPSVGEVMAQVGQQVWLPRPGSLPTRKPLDLYIFLRGAQTL